MKPDFSEAVLRLGELLVHLGRFPEALDLLQGFATARPGQIDIWMRLGNFLEAAGNHRAAIKCYQHVITRSPGYDPAYTALANAWYFIGEHGMAMENYRKASEINPTNLRALLGKHLLLPYIYETREHMHSARAGFMEGISKLCAMAAKFKISRTLIDDLQWSYNFYLAYQGLDDRGAQEQYGKFFTEMVGHCLPQFMRPIQSSTTSRRRIRVDYAGHFFHNHTVAYYFNNWIMRADRDHFETYVYHIDPVVDLASQRVAGGCARYRPVTGRIEGIAQCIRNDALDILVFPEVGMYSKTQWLAALRLAPIQCVAWGHPVTTGLANIDYALSAAASEPDNAGHHYTEKLVCLDGIGACIDAPDRVEPASPEEFGIAADRNLYLSPQSLFKIHLDMDMIMADIASRDPDRFIRFLPRMKSADFVRINRLSYVMIDTPHWPGGRTSLDALGTGLPIVTLPGEYSRGRQTFGMLQELGLPELVDGDREDYVDKAAKIARDKDMQARLSEKILSASAGVLFNNPAPVSALEACYQAWMS